MGSMVLQTRTWNIQFGSAVGAMHNSMRLESLIDSQGVWPRLTLHCQNSVHLGINHICRAQLHFPIVS